MLVLSQFTVNFLFLFYMIGHFIRIMLPQKHFISILKLCMIIICKTLQVLFLPFLTIALRLMFMYSNQTNLSDLIRTILPFLKVMKEIEKVQPLYCLSLLSIIFEYLLFLFLFIVLAPLNIDNLF